MNAVAAPLDKRNTLDSAQAASPPEIFARLFAYPAAATAVDAAAAADGALAAGHPCTDALESFALQARTLSVPELQEAYTRAFDLNPATTLEVGWHLFGDTYKRGQFLAYLRPELRRLGVETGHELPDHLAVLLRLWSRLPADDADGLAADCLLPALDKILPPLEGGPYAALVEGLRQWLDPHRGAPKPPRKPLELPVLENGMEGTHA